MLAFPRSTEAQAHANVLGDDLFFNTGELSGETWDVNPISLRGQTILNSNN